MTKAFDSVVFGSEYTYLRGLEKVNDADGRYLETLQTDRGSHGNRVKFT